VIQSIFTNVIHVIFGNVIHP